MYTYTDKTLTCADCNQEFSFSASEQQFYADRQFSEPRRCPSCRAIRKASRGDSGGSYAGNGGGYGGGYASGGGYGQREMYTATCDGCCGEARVPFQPSGSLVRAPGVGNLGQRFQAVGSSFGTGSRATEDMKRSGSPDDSMRFTADCT